MAEGCHGDKDETDFGGDDLEVDFPEDVKVSFPFQTTGASDGEDDDDDCEAQGAGQGEFLKHLDFYFPDELKGYVKNYKFGQFA